MFSTGPMFLTHEASYYSDRSSLDILSPELYGKYSHNSSHALFHHLKGLIIHLVFIQLIIYFSFILAWE
jgi:hypothetical protein